MIKMLDKRSVNRPRFNEIFVRDVSLADILYLDQKRV